MLGWNGRRVRVEETEKAWVEGHIVRSALDRVNNKANKNEGKLKGEQLAEI